MKKQTNIGIAVFIILLTLMLTSCSESRSGNYDENGEPKKDTIPSTTKRVVQGWWISTLTFDTLSLKNVEIKYVDTIYKVGDSFNDGGVYNYRIIR